MGREMHLRDLCRGPGEGSGKLIYDSGADNEQKKGSVAGTASPSAIFFFFYKLHEMPNVLKKLYDSNRKQFFLFEVFTGSASKFP